MSRLLRTILIVLGLTIALTSAGLGLVLAKDEPVAVGQVRKTTAVLVAARPILAGNRIEKADLGWKEILTGAVPAGAMAKPGNSELNAIGSVAVQNVAAGEMIAEQMLTRPAAGDSLAGNLNPGWRAVTFEADASQNAAGMLLPNDKVDLFLAVPTGQSAPIANPLPFAKTSGAGLGDDSTSIANVRVIAVNGAMRAAGTSAADIKGSSTLTLELRPEQVAAVLGAAASGRLGIALRSRFDAAAASALGNSTKPASPSPKQPSANARTKSAKRAKTDAIQTLSPGVIIIRGWEKSRAN